MERERERPVEHTWVGKIFDIEAGKCNGLTAYIGISTDSTYTPTVDYATMPLARSGFTRSQNPAARPSRRLSLAAT